MLLAHVYLKGEGVMPDKAFNPRDSRMAELTRMSEPYHFQRDRQIGNKQPRPPQPAVQPNRLSPPVGWGVSSFDYWRGLSKYMRREQ